MSDTKKEKFDLSKEQLEELNQLKEETQPQACGIDKNITSENEIPEACSINTHAQAPKTKLDLSKEQLEELNQLKEDSQPQACGINKNITTENEMPEACSINTHAQAPKTKLDLSKEQLEELNQLKEDSQPQACGINRNITSENEIPEACSINAHATAPDSENSKFKLSQKQLEELNQLKEDSQPQACGINRNVTSENEVPEACSINAHDSNIPQKPKHEEKQVDLNTVNILDTYGFNVPVSEEIRKELVDKLNEYDSEHKISLDGIEIFIETNGPYEVYGDIPIYDDAIKTNEQGQSVGWEYRKRLEHKGPIFLCRCGRSKHLPFCDGTHVDVHFDGTLTASNEPYNEAAKIYRGCPGAYLMDEESLCAIVRFCDPDGSCWNLVKDSETLDKAIEETFNCASGRLTVIKDDKKVEPDYKPEIELILDTERKELGPIWVKGNIPVKSHKQTYQVRNRVTLCRCGRSHNKPFCDGMHLTCPELTPEEMKEYE